MDIDSISKEVFAKMGCPKEFSASAFRAALWAELDKRGLGADRAQYIYLFGQVEPRVRKLVHRQSKKLAARSAMPVRQLELPVEFERLAANSKT